MCTHCGCSISTASEQPPEPAAEDPQPGRDTTAVGVFQSLLVENDHQATHNRRHFDTHGVLAINLMSSPGAGKTALLESTIDGLGERCRIAVIEGDLATENDARRIRAKGVNAVQISTGTACHLDAHMVHDALHQLDLGGLDLVFIENVGNLVCPASFDLGHHRNVTLLSVTEGDDKPAKYPVMFRAADVVLLTKTDLLRHLDDFDPESAERCLRRLASTAPVVPASVRQPNGPEGWLQWLEREIAAHRERLQRQETVRPAVQTDGARMHHLA